MLYPVSESIMYVEGVLADVAIKSSAAHDTSFRVLKSLLTHHVAS